VLGKSEDNIYKMKKIILFSLAITMLLSCKTRKPIDDPYVEDDYDYVMRDTVYNINGTIITSPIYNKK